MLEAIATCLLEHCIESAFDITKDIENRLNAGDKKIAECFLYCDKFGSALEPENALRFEKLQITARILLDRS
jgi:hypothetical protein